MGALTAAFLVALPPRIAFASENGLIAFRHTVNRNNDIYVMRPDGTGIRTLVATPKNESQPTWSPDGSMLVFEANYDGDFDIWGMTPDGFVRRLVGGPANDGVNETQPAWSPDGTEIAYTSNATGNFEIMVSQLGGGGLVNISQSPARDTAPAWSPNGSRIAFGSDRTGNYDIWSVAPDGSDALDLTAASLANDSQPAWSPDGSAIAFLSNASDGNGIWRMDADGGTRVFLSGPGAADSSPIWSPDGTTIAFQRYVATSWQIWLMDREGTNQRPLTSVGTDSGALLLTSSARADWQAIPNADDLAGPTSLISSPEDGSVLRPQDLREIRGIARDDHSAIARVEVALRATLADGTCEWWTDDRLVAGDCKQRHWVTAGGADSWSLALGSDLPPDDPGTSLRWYTLFSRATDELWNTDSNAIRGVNRIGFHIESNSLPVQTGSDGTIAFSSDRGGGLGIFELDPSSGTVVRLTDSSWRASYPAWSPDGDSIAFQSNHAGTWDIYVMDQTGHITRVTTDNQANETQPAWSPDGTRLTYASNATGNWDVYVISADGSSPPTDLTNNPAVDRGATSSPDGSRIAFASDRSGNYDVYTMAPSGSDVRQLTNDPATDSHPEWSPAGAWLLFDSSRTGDREMWKVPSNGGTPVQITFTAEVDEYGASWSPDGRQVVFEGLRGGNWDLFAMDPDGARVVDLTPGTSKDQHPDWLSIS